MRDTTRRSLLRGSLAIAAAGGLARPFIANAAATTATVWWSQGFAQEEDVAFRKIVADYEKASGNTIDPSIVPFAPLRQKIISAMTSGAVPDVIDGNPIEVVALQAWDGKLVDVSDVVETQKARIMPSALLGARCYNNVEKRRSFYGVPYKGSVRPFHYWRDLVEKAGYQESDIPNTWDAFIDFFKPVQQKLRAQGLRHTFATGFVLSTVGFDVASTFDQFLIAYGGGGLVTKDGKLHADDPRVKEAALKALTYLGALYREGYVPPGTVSWNDADDNNAYHSKLCVMDLDGTLSTEVAMIHDKQAYYHDMVVHGLPLSNEGKPIPSVFAANLAFIPKGAKNVEVGKEFIGLPDPAQGQRRLFEGRARPVSAGDAGTRHQRPVVDRPQAGPAPAALCAAGVRRTDHPLLLGVQPGLCRGRDRACLGLGPRRCDGRRHGAAGGGRQGAQADRGDLRQISDRAELSGLSGRHRRGKRRARISWRTGRRRGPCARARGTRI